MAKHSKINDEGILRKINYKRIIRIELLLLAVCFIVVGSFRLVKYVPSVKEALTLATTVKPETFTELYFEDHLSLPDKVTLFKENNFKFTIHNLENKDMEYKYEIYVDMTKKRKRMIDKGSVLIKNNEYKTISEEFTITIPIQRVKVAVNLISKSQQIHFWMGEE